MEPYGVGRVWVLNEVVDPPKSSCNRVARVYKTVLWLKPMMHSNLTLLKLPKPYLQQFTLIILDQEKDFPSCS